MRHETDPKPYHSLRAPLAEYFGVFVLTLIDGGIGILASQTPEPPGILAKALAPAFVVMTMIFILGPVSGAHINPAVTLAFTLRGVFPKARAVLYVAVQILGALTAAFVLAMVFPGQLTLALTQIKILPGVGAILELLMTVFLVTTILSTSVESSVTGPEAAFPVGFCLAFCGLLGKAVTGASMNPARTLGPALVSGQIENLWIYLSMPLIGAALAVALTWIIQGPPNAKERAAARGK